MKLNKFQQFVKDEEVEADKSIFDSKCFMADIKADFNDVYQNLRLEIEGSIDMSDIVGYSLDFGSSKIWEEIEDQIRLKVNELIVKTLEEIEGTEEDAENNEPCDIEYFKRDRELNQ